MKLTKLFTGILLLSTLLLCLCVENRETTEAPILEAADIAEEKQEVVETETPADALSDLQKGACTTSDAAGTCGTKLAELDIVSPEECCMYLDKCCEEGSITTEEAVDYAEEHPNEVIGFSVYVK